MVKHYLIRHTRPEISQGTCYGQTDIDIKDNFEKKFKAVKNLLPSKNMPVYSSPLKRCLKLAKFLCPKTVSVDSRLKEINFGNWELKKWEEIPKDEIEPWYEDYIHVSPPCGESFESLYERVKDFYENTLSKQSGPCIVVAHGGPLRILVGLNQGLELNEMMDIQIGFGEVLTLNY